MQSEKVLEFKTNINCSGCIKAVTPWLDQAEGIKKWTVNTEHPDKILTVFSAGLQAEGIKELVRKAGFEINEL